MTCPFHGLDPCWRCGVARVRAAIVPPPSRDTDPDPTRAAAIHRARTERTKETKP